MNIISRDHILQCILKGKYIVPALTGQSHFWQQYHSKDKDLKQGIDFFFFLQEISPDTCLYLVHFLFYIKISNSILTFLMFHGHTVDVLILAATKKYTDNSDQLVMEEY